MKDEKRTQVAGTGYVNIGHAPLTEGSKSEAVMAPWYSEGPAVLTLSADEGPGNAFVEIEVASEVKPVKARIVLPTKVPRKLRAIATYVRTQGRLDMDIQDELRALAALAKTLDSLPDPVASRVLQWLNSRHHTRPAPSAGMERTYPWTTEPAVPPSKEESLGIARERLGS